ncbi:hypothetical protein ACFQ9R_34155 [Nocardia sp. NPDC056541]|uniref:hypothetical protein n=1 Tax=Nocardia sp. NPDC056541 TaxID=3345860 RepID=UPI003671DE51
MLHQREGYWETRKEPTWTRAQIFDRNDRRSVVQALGVLGVLYDAELCDGAPGIRVGLGHRDSGMHLELAVDEAMELIELLAAAIGDANGVEQPCIDLTFEPCTWACCKAVR